MWSLPNIVKMNERKAEEAKANAKKTEKQLCRGQKCEFCQAKATHAEPYFDIYSDDERGYTFTCDECHDSGRDSDSLFYCSHCGKTYLTNITWENHYTIIDGEQLCLNCAFDQYVADDKNWITDARNIDFERIRKSPHLIAVDSDHWRKSLVFIGNVEFSSWDGTSLSGGGVSGAKELVKKAIADHGKALLILDGAYQFAVSIGVYAPLKPAKRKPVKTRKANAA